MGRPSLVPLRRRELIPVLARAFAELGYRRTTTAEMARRCGVRENVLYRLWPDKESMFVAAIVYVYELSETTWQRLMAEAGGGAAAARRLLAYEAEHQGEFGHYRILFGALNETDVPEIRRALRGMFRRFQGFLAERVAAGRGSGRRRARPEPGLAAWALLGLGTAVNIGRELGILDARQRRGLMAEVGELLLAGRG